MHEQQPHQALNDDALVLPLDTLLSALKHSLMPYDAAGVPAGRLSGLTAIVAREYGIPVVVGVVGAIDRIRTGQLVTVSLTLQAHARMEHCGRMTDATIKGRCRHESRTPTNRKYTGSPSRTQQRALAR